MGRAPSPATPSSFSAPSRSARGWSRSSSQSSSTATWRSATSWSLSSRDAENPRKFRVKVTDYGLTREGKCYCGGNGTLPTRWVPPEALERRRWSEKSNVWAFGVLMWELWSAARIPFAFEGNDENVARRVCEGERLPRPSRCPESVYAAMQKCWATTAQDRPSFRDLRNNLLELYGATVLEAAQEGEGSGGNCVICLGTPAEPHFGPLRPPVCLPRVASPDGGRNMPCMPPACARDGESVPSLTSAQEV